MASQPQHPQGSSIPAQLHLTEEEWYQRVSRKAYELYQQRGEVPGHELDDWLTAERLVQEELCHGPSVPDPILADGDVMSDDEDVPQ